MLSLFEDAIQLFNTHTLTLTTNCIMFFRNPNHYHQIMMNSFLIWFVHKILLQKCFDDVDDVFVSFFTLFISVFVFLCDFFLLLSIVKHLIWLKINSCLIIFLDENSWQTFLFKNLKIQIDKLANSAISTDSVLPWGSFIYFLHHHHRSVFWSDWKY